MAQTTPTSPSAQSPQRNFLGHPGGLLNLAGVELWERFSFYGMQAILAFYLYFSLTDGGLGIDQKVAVGILGAYGGAVYLSQVLGTWIADRVLGPERTVFIGGVLITAGHIALAVIPAVGGVVVALILIVLGTGGLKANVTALVGTLYKPNDERRDSGFSLFYTGINLGAFIGPILTGLLQDRLGFHVGFGLAAVGMILGLIQYVLGRKNLGPDARTVPNPLTGRQPVIYSVIAVVAIIVIVLVVLIGWVRPDNLAAVVTWVIVAAAVAYFVIMLTSKQLQPEERSRVFAFIPLFIASFAFWSLFQQQFTLLPVYAEQRINLDLGGFLIPPAWFNSVEPLFVIVLAPVFAWLWLKLGGRQPSSPAKFTIGTVGIGIAFLIMLTMSGTTGAVNSPWILGLVLLIFAVAELCLSPVGLSLATKLAPRAFKSQMVALFFLSIAAGSSVAGQLAGLYSPQHEAAYFGIVGGVAIAIGVLLAICAPLVKRLMAGVK